MQQIFLLMGIILFSLSSTAQNTVRATGDTVRTDAVLKTATVYFGYGAELTHESNVRVNSDTRIIVINRLSTAIDISSLQVSCPEDVALLSQKFSIYYPTVTPVVKTRQVQVWEDSIALIQKEIDRVESDIVIGQEVLNKTGLLIENALNNKDKTVNSAELLKLVDYYTARIEVLRNRIYEYRQVIARKRERIAELNNKIADAMRAVAPLPAKPYGQLVLQVMCTQARDIPVSLSYYTNHAGWTPVYDIRVNSKTNKVKLVYKASLMQTTGIDWRKTRLTLSTGTPTFGVTAPVLSPWYLQLYVPGLYNDLQRRVAVGNAMRNNIQSYENDKALQEVIVSGYGALKQEKAYLDTVSTLQQYTTLNEGQLNTNFEISLPYDIESDGQLHSVSIKEEEISCTLKNYAVPRADKEAYLLAEIADWQNLDLLPGEANIVMDDTYIGKSSIDPNTTADTLNLSLGRDKRVAVKRSLVKEMSSLRASGKDNRQTFTYEIVVKNNKLTDVNLLLKDQFPLSTIKEVEVKLDDDGDASVNGETGVLTWKLSLKPGESKKIRFSYTVKFPKDKKIVNLK